jgi:hypothetical protein
MPRALRKPTSRGQGRQIVFASKPARKVTAVALTTLLLSSAVPWPAFGQTGDYSGSASGAAADIRLPGPGGSPPVHAVYAESTGAVNSEAGIIPDVPSTEADETEDFAVGTATPVRGEAGGRRDVPRSVQSSAPDDAAGSTDMVGPSTGTGLSAAHAETSSQAARDGSTAATENATSFTSGRFDFHLPLNMPTGGSGATVEREANGLVTATGQVQLAGSGSQRISVFGGHVTAAMIDALSTSTADGTSSANVSDFHIQDLRLGIPGTGGATYITANAHAGSGNMIDVTVSITVPNGPTATQTISILRGSNLLDANIYQGTTLAPAFAALTPSYLTPLTQTGGTLQGLQLILGDGYSDDGDGTYARGLVEALKTSIVVGTATVAHTLGRAYSAADADRAFSTATDPSLPPGTVPTSNAAAAFPETRAASPTEIAFARDEQPAEPVNQPGSVPPPLPAEEPDRAPVSDTPAEPEAPNEPNEGPVADRSGPPATAPVATATAATETGTTLPFTGLNVMVIAVLGLALVALGVLGRRATRPPGAGVAVSGSSLAP